MTEGLESKVSAWLDREGYPLELRTARAFERQGWDVTISDYYKDGRTDEYREIDVVAQLIRSSDPWGSVFRVFFTVECKRSVEKPWLAFTSLNATPPFEGFSVVERPVSPAGFAALGGVSLDAEIQQMRLFRLEHRPAYGLTQAFTKGADQTFMALLAATNAAANKAELYSEPELPTRGRPGQVTIAFPIVVVDAPLLECYLDDEGDLQVSEIEVATLTWRRPYTTRRYAWPRTHVHVVQAQHMESFVAEVTSDARRLLTAIGGVAEIGEARVVKGRGAKLKSAET